CARVPGRRSRGDQRHLCDRPGRPVREERDVSAGMQGRGDGPSQSIPGGIRPRFPEIASDALRYWEPRRLLYNLALLLVVLAHFYSSWPDSKAFLTRDTFLGFFFLAVLANVLYCAAYAADLFVQFSGQRAAWARWRWMVLVTGIAFAAVITHFITMGILA